MEKLLQDRENLKLFQVGIDVPDGYELVEIEVKTKLSESEYGDLIDTLALQAIKDGTIKITRRTDEEKPKDEATLGDFISAMGGLMTAFAPKEDAEKIQEGVNQMAQLFSALEPNGSQKSTKEEEGGIKFEKVPITSSGRMATVEEIEGNFEKVKKLLMEWDDWTIALVEGGKLVGSGYGGKIEAGDFNKQVEDKIIGEKIIVIESQSNETVKEMEETVEVKSISQASPDMEEDSVNFASKGDAGLHRENRMGSYIKTSQIVKGCPVFEQVNKQEDEKQHYLFVGPDGRWRVGPDVTSYSGSVLKHPKKNAKQPPNNGWLYYLDDKWKEAEALCVSVNVKDGKGKEEAVKFVSKGDAGSHRKTRMGSFIKISQTTKGCPVFEQVNTLEDEKQHYLFVGPDGRWRVGPDFTSYSGSVLKHPEKNAEKPPKNGWLYYLDDKWNEDNTLQLLTNKAVTGVSKPKAAQRNKIPSNCDCTIVEEFVIGEDYHAIKFKNIKCLGIAILKGDTAAVETSLGKGCDVNYDETDIGNFYNENENDYEGLTPLIIACRWSSLPIISLLVKHPGIDLDKRIADVLGETALHWAVRKPENLDLVKLLVEAGAKIYLRDGKGNSYLHRAVEAGALEIVKYLHSKGASVNTHGRGRHTPLWRAVDEENLAMVRYLVENGAYLNSTKSFYGFNPFHQAIHKGNGDIVKYMIEQGADITAKGNEKYFGETCLEIAQKGMESGEYEYEKKENKRKYGEIITMLQAAEAVSKPVEAVDEEIVEAFEVSEEVKFENVSSLGIAVLQNDIKAVEACLEKGCNVNFDKIERNGDGGWTPLMLACEQSSLPIVSLLLKQPGIEIDKVEGRNDENALNRAVRRDQNLDMVKLLVEAGADPDMRCKYGFSHLHQAAYSGHLDIIKYLQSKGAYINTQDNGLTTPLWLAANYGNLEIVKYCASQGATLDTPRAWLGYFPLNVAVANAHVDVVKFLIEQGADVDKECESFGSREGVSQSNLEIVRSRREDGFSYEIAEKKPLYDEIIRLLKEAGAKGVNEEEIKKLVLDTLDAVMWIWAEKIDVVTAPFPSWDWPNSGDLPHSISKLKVMTDQHDVWLAMVRAIVDVVPHEHPLGAITIAMIIRRTPMPVEFDPNIVDTYLKVLEIASSFEANDSRHGNISIILSAIAGDIKRFWMRGYAIQLSQLVLNPAMLDYIFGNLKPGSKPEAAIFSLLALEFLADDKENGENPNAEIVKKRFREYGPDDHPLLQMEKLVDSDNLAEKQAGFCARWYLDNLWTIDNQDARSGKKIDNTNVNAKLIPSEKSKYLKVGPSGLELRADGPWFETAISTVQVDVGSWYYEVTIVTGGFMQIGWATKQSEFLETRGYGVGDDEFSLSYDGCRHVAWYNKLQPSGDEALGWSTACGGDGYRDIKSWKAGDVVGSLIDIENQEIVFSLNGVNIRSEPYKDVFEKVKEGFFAAVSLMSFQQCQVNFGKDPFKHAPEGKQFKPLNEASTTKSF